MPAGDDMTLVFADGEVMSVPAAARHSILESAEKCGNRLAHDCREGSCRTCAARDPGGREVLLCIEPARGGLRLSLPYRRADIAPATMRRARINGFARASRSVWVLRYRLQFALPFLPGQYVEARFPGIDGPRRFSMANAPGETEQVLHIRDIPGGAMSAYLGRRAAPDDLFTVRGPLGAFYLRATPKPKLFVAGGTGLAPLVSMLRSQDRATAPPLAVVAGFADGEDAYGLEELERLARELPLEVVPTAERADAAWPGHRGTAVEALGTVRTVPLEPGTEAYICGPPGMVTAARSRLLGLGLSPDEIFNEEFVPSPTDP